MHGPEVCRGYQLGGATEFAGKKKKKSLDDIYRAALTLHANKTFTDWLKKREKSNQQSENARLSLSNARPPTRFSLSRRQ